MCEQAAKPGAKQARSAKRAWEVTLKDTAKRPRQGLQAMALR